VAKRNLASVIDNLLVKVFNKKLPINLELWDGSISESIGSNCKIIVRSPNAFKRLLFAPGELGLARAFISGDLDLEGSIFDLVDLRKAIADDYGKVNLNFNLKVKFEILKSLIHLKAVGLPPKPPSIEIKPISRIGKSPHSKLRDKEDISYHYDVSNEFYRTFLGPTMVYSCGYFGNDYNRKLEPTLEQAQLDKCDLVCRKLQLKDGQRLLDIGCGWGTLLIYAAKKYNIRGVGVTLSKQQFEYATLKIKELNLDDRIEVRLQDYRDIKNEVFDAICSIGMAEHVGKAELQQYFKKVYSLLTDQGRFLNHAISRPKDDGRKSGTTGRNSFINRYVFPDGELEEVGYLINTMQNSNFEVRDVESLREHYAKTLKCWISNLEKNMDEAVKLVGEQRYRVWRLYMAGSSVTFSDNNVSIHQVLGVKTSKSGSANIPLSRLKWIFDLTKKTPELSDIEPDK
jgi:cyclopropane-fatty-acyl-phospholipid synthase